MTSDPTDYDALARRYLDLWQQEMTKLAQDPNAAGAWTNLFQGMMQNASAAWASGSEVMTAAQKTSGLYNGRANPFSPTSAPADRSAPAAAASGNGGLDVADVLRRLDAIEQRLSALEATPPPRRRTKPAKS